MEMLQIKYLKDSVPPAYNYPYELLADFPGQFNIQIIPYCQTNNCPLAL